jgi:hypothetical protein
MSTNSVSKRSSSVAQEDLKMKPPLSGFFRSLAPPRGDESMVDACASVIADARAGLNGMDAGELISACEMCDEHGRDVKLFQEKKPGAVASKLTPSLVAALALYTAELSGESPYSVCNGALRAGERAKCKPFVPFIWLVMHALAKCERYEGGNVYRGVKADLTADYPKDREVTWFQFSSCTCDIQVQQSDQFCGSSGPRTLFSIELTTGRARIITKFSLVPSEAEVLLPPNSRFKVVSHFDAGNGLTIIQLKELPTKDPIIEFDAALSSTSAPAAGGGHVSASSATYPPGFGGQTLSFHLGAHIVIDGLQAKPEINGCTGVICGDFDPASGRWTVRLDSGGAVFQLLPHNMTLMMAGASSSVAGFVPPSPVPASTAVTSISSAAWPSVLQQLQAVLTPEAAASVRFYRNIDFAASVCEDSSKTCRDLEQAADATLYARACSTLHTIVAGQAQPASVHTLASALAQGQQVIPSIQAAQDAAKAAGDNAKASQLHALRYTAAAFIFWFYNVFETLTAGCP